MCYRVQLSVCHLQDKNSPVGLEGTAKRFVKFGGGVGDEQLRWLRQQLGEAQAASQLVMVGCHLPVCRGAASDVCLLWNYDEVVEVLHEAGNVVAFIAGREWAARAVGTGRT